VRVTRDDADSWVPRRSDRLAAKAPFREPKPEKQAKRVLVHKWTPGANRTGQRTPDATIAAKFHDTFSMPLSESKREAPWRLHSSSRCTLLVSVLAAQS
jgi:hypothetical protein